MMKVVASDSLSCTPSPQSRVTDVLYSSDILTDGDCPSE